MKNFKLFGIIMMLVMGMSFTSCGEDDENPDEPVEGTSTESINKNLAGEWFRVEASHTENGETFTQTWDYSNQTQNSNYGIEPMIYIIKKIDDNVFEVTAYEYYNNEWCENGNGSEIFQLNGNIIGESSNENEYYIEKTKIYISELSENKLVITSDTYDYDKTSGVEEAYTTKIIFQRNK